MSTDHKNYYPESEAATETTIRPVGNLRVNPSRGTVSPAATVSLPPRVTTGILGRPDLIKEIKTPKLQSRMLLDYRQTRYAQYGLVSNLRFLANAQTIPPVNILGDPIHLGRYIIWPDRKRRKLFYHLAQPELADFSLTIEKENVDTIRTKGGRAILSLRMYPQRAAIELETMRTDYRQELDAYSDWSFEAISLKNIRTELRSPGAQEISETEVSVSDEAGSIIFLLDLTAVGANNWHDLIRNRQQQHIQGICDVSANFYAKDGDKVESKAVSMNALLSDLLTQASLEDVHVMNPTLSLDTHILVQGHPILQSVSVDFKPSQGHPPKTFNFDENGGQVTTTVTGTDLEDLTIELTHKVDFDQGNWPIIRDSKVLTYRNNNWSEVIDPASWMTRYTLMVFLLDENGNVISEEAVDPANRVICELLYKADYLEGSNSILNVIETSSESIEEIHFPLPEGEAPGELKLTVTALRMQNGQIPAPALKVRNLSASATAIIIKVWPDGTIDIQTNEDALTERSLEDEMLSTLDQLYHARPAASGESEVRPAEGESGFYQESDTPEFRRLLRYLRTDEAGFSEIEPWYFPELENYLIYHGILSDYELIDRYNFHEAVAEFQNSQSLSADGIPGEQTLWKLQLPYVQDHPKEIRRVEADRLPGYEEGYTSFRLREDAAFYYEGLREEVRNYGGAITSSGSLRALTARVTSGRSSKSMHYTGIAFDLYIHSGMKDPKIDPFIITENGRKWTVYCRVPYGGETKRLDAVYWKNRRLHSESVVARVINFTELASYYGFYNISRRSCFPHNYLCAEWWHFQNEFVVTPYLSQFGTEVLRLNTVDYERLQRSPLWANRKHIFHRNWF